MASIRTTQPDHLTATPPSRRLPHVPALDGLRGVAVLGVVLFHAGYLDGGFLGVDLFFVLSGFLITGLLLDDADSAGGRIRLGRFYARRARRLAPALLVVVLAVGALAPLLLDDGVLADVRDSGIATLLYFANWHEIATEQDYFVAVAGTNPFEHTWSLAIEEQVYLAWPLLVLLAVRVGRRRSEPRRVVIGLALGLAALSLVAAALVHGGSTARAYYGTDTRAFAVLAGAVAAAASRPPRVRAWVASSPVAAAAGIAAGAALAASWVVVEGTDAVLYDGLLPLLGAAGAIVVGTVAATGARPLTARPLVGLGLISYGLYLWHWPVFVVLDADRMGYGGVGLAAVRIATSVALAVVSYLVVERPVRSGRLRSSHWRVVLPAGFAAASIALALGTAGAVDREGGDFGESASAGLTATPDERPRLLVLGDSQAFELAYHAAGPGADRFQLASSTFLGCGIGPGLPVSDGIAVTESLVGESCDDVLATWASAVDEFDPDVALVHVGAWEVLDRRIGDRDVAFGSSAWDTRTAARIGDVMDALEGDGRRVVWLAAPCFAPEGDSGGPAERRDHARAARWNELLRAEATSHGDAVLAYDDFTCRGPVSDDRLDGVDFRRDGVHLTPEAAPMVWSWIADQLGAPP